MLNKTLLVNSHFQTSVISAKKSKLFKFNIIVHTANDNVRKARGWEYIEGVDKHNTEIHLDNCDNLWQFKFQNHTNDLDIYEKTLSPLINELKEII